VNALHRQFGFGSATFINGDERLDGLEQASGVTKAISQPKTNGRGRTPTFGMREDAP